MIHNGVKLRRSRALGYRMAIEGDKNLRGEQVDSNYVSIIRIKDCEIYEKDGRKYYKGDDPFVKCIPINHGGTYYGYGERNKGTYTETKLYVVNDGYVHTGVIRKKI